MCGIIGYVGKRDDAPELILMGLKNLEYRGYDSWGVAVVNEGVIFSKKKVGKIGGATVADLPKSNFGFGHTRWATHGGVNEVNAHPHLDCSGQIAVIHNGIIENYEEIKRDLLNKKHELISETDTEVFAHLVEELTKTNDFVTASRKAFGKVTGLNAFMVINAKDKQMVAVRNGSPLVVGFGKNENFVASDASALGSYTKRVYFLEDDEMAVISDSGVKILDAKTGRGIVPKITTLDLKVDEIGKGEFPHFMIKEIYEQPKIIENIAASGITEAARAALEIEKSFGTYLIGCGTAYYACLAGSYIFSKVAKKHVNACVGSEFGYQLDFLTPKSLVVALSQSGETMDILEAMKKAQIMKAKSMALVNVAGSTLYRTAETKILLGAGVEKAVASTKAFTAKVAYLILIAYILADKRQAGQKVLESAVSSIKEILNPKSVDRIKKLVGLISKGKHIYVVGRGLSFPAALETALKIKEISYIHAEGLAAGELKHGVLALIEKGSPCLVFLPNDETYGANLAGAMEMKARGGYIIGVSFAPHEIFDFFIPVADAKEATIIPNVVVGQLLAYYLAVKLQLDPDMPRNLAKSVTVK